MYDVDILELFGSDDYFYRMMMPGEEKNNCFCIQKVCLPIVFGVPSQCQFYRIHPSAAHTRVCAPPNISLVSGGGAGRSEPWQHNPFLCTACLSGVPFPVQGVRAYTGEYGGAKHFGVKCRSFFFAKFIVQDRCPFHEKKLFTKS